MHQTSPRYVAIDLGSNSFHMFVVEVIDGQIYVVERIKRKVRLAHGVDEQGRLHPDAMQRGWDCLSLFAPSLQDLPADNIRIVATAALRLATNASEFTDKAKRILGFPIDIISGEREAQLIYQGAISTSSEAIQRLMIDIGGASTELIIGQDREIKALNSLHLGCVTWLDRYFADHRLNEDNFSQAIEAAKQVLDEAKATYLALGWQTCLGASGTVQTLQRIFTAQGLSSEITLEKLHHIKQLAIQAKTISSLNIDGLEEQQKLVLASGLSILIAIFESLSITNMNVANGALREGLIYDLIHHHGLHVQPTPFSFDNYIEK